MSRVVSKPVEKMYTVDDWRVGFAQVAEGEVILLLDIEGQRDAMFKEGVFVGYREQYNDRRARRQMIYRTMTLCDLVWEDESPIFASKDNRVRLAMSEVQFNAAWDQLPPDYAEAILEKFKEHNPAPGESKATSQK